MRFFAENPEKQIAMAAASKSIGRKVSAEIMERHFVSIYYKAIDVHNGKTYSSFQPDNATLKS